MSTSAVATPGTEGDQKTTISQAQVIETTTNEPPPEYELPKPRTAFSSFVDHPENFITFLEACIKSSEIEEEDKRDLYTTLFEMYLHTATQTKNEEREGWESKAKALIGSQKVSLRTFAPRSP